MSKWRRLTANLGVYQDSVDAALAEMKGQQIIERIWAHDHTVWKPDPTEITNRLGWLHIAEAMLENIPRLESLVEAARAAGYTHALLLGMGGSSLAPEVFRETFGVKEGRLDLAVLDSTDPGAVLTCAERLDLSKTLFIVATKSGSTVETLSFFKFFYNQVSETVGADQAGAHFVAITDPGSKLADIAHRHGFRATFLNDPHIGGRYSALSYFGLLPAALVGVDVETLLHRAVAMARDCAVAEDNDGGRLGAIMGELAQAGRDKATIIASPGIASFGNWVEQLVAESTGKEGKGILPVVGEPVGTPDVYDDDRLFIYPRLEDDDTHDAAVQALENAGHPVVRLRLNDLYDLGGQFFLWEMATAVAGHRLGINPFEQPNVEAAKVLARQMVAEYKEKGALPAEAPVLATGGIAVYRDMKAWGSGKKKVVVVEDEPEMADLVKLILGRKGFELVGAVGGREGLETIRRVKPDLVLLDLMMPDMDGWEVYQQMKADEELKDIPVVVVTAKAQSIDKVLGLHMAEPDNLAGILSKLHTPRPTGDTEKAHSPGEALNEFLAQAGSGDYIALQAYIQPTTETDAALAALRIRLRDRFKLATTVGYGPRFLHSTGQLHKGDAGNGLFIQFTADDARDAPIPDEAGAPDSSISFGVLKMAQALGDRQALLNAGRRVIRFHLGDDVIGALKQLTEALA
jgi:glucose-6-phosphate isomerase/ActR/RegA family two-component response regulator